MEKPNLHGKFRKLLSNKLQASAFSRSDMYNNFKTPSRVSALERSTILTHCSDDLNLEQRFIITQIPLTPSLNHIARSPSFSESQSSPKRQLHYIAQEDHSKGNTINSPSNNSNIYKTSSKIFEEQLQQQQQFSRKSLNSRSNLLQSGKGQNSFLLSLGDSVPGSPRPKVRQNLFSSHASKNKEIPKLNMLSNSLSAAVVSSAQVVENNNNNQYNNKSISTSSNSTTNANSKLNQILFQAKNNHNNKININDNNSLKMNKNNNNNILNRCSTDDNDYNINNNNTRMNLKPSNTASYLFGEAKVAEQKHKVNQEDRNYKISDSLSDAKFGTRSVTLNSASSNNLMQTLSNKEIIMNSQEKTPEINNNNSNISIAQLMFQQGQYASRTKDKEFENLSQESQQRKQQNDLNQLDIPTCNEYMNFIRRQNSLKKLLEQFANQQGLQVDFTKQLKQQDKNNSLFQFQQNNSKNLQQLRGNRLSAPNIFNQRKYTVSKDKQTQNKLKGSEQLKQQFYSNHSGSSKGLQTDMIDQQLFESYLDCLKSNYAISQPISNGINNSNNIEIRTRNAPDIYQYKQQQQLQQSIKSKDISNKNNSSHNPVEIVSPGTVSFNPNAFAQEHYISPAMKNNVKLHQIDLKTQAQAATIANSGEDNNNNNSPLSGIEKAQRQIQGSAFIVVSTPKSNGNTDDVRILSTKKTSNNIFNIQGDATSTKRHNRKIELNEFPASQPDEINSATSPPNRLMKLGSCSTPKNQQIQSFSQQYQSSPRSQQYSQQQFLLQQWQNQQKQWQQLENLDSRELIDKNQKVDEIDSLVVSLKGQVEELKGMYNSDIQLVNTFEKVPGFNDLIAQILLKDSHSHELKTAITVETTKQVLIEYLFTENVLTKPMNATINGNNSQATSEFLSQIDISHLPLYAVDAILKKIVYFCRSLGSVVKQKRADHQRKEVDDLKTEIKQISDKTQQHIKTLNQKVPQKQANIQELGQVQKNISHILDRKNYIKQQPFIEYFEGKEEILGKFKKVNEHSRVQSKCLNELNDILRDFQKYS